MRKAATLKEGTRKQLLHDIHQAIVSIELEHEVMTVHNNSKRNRYQTAREIDVLELFAGVMKFSTRAHLFGFQAGEPGDYDSGWDFFLAEYSAKCIASVKRTLPKFVTTKFECTPYCWYNAYINYQDRPQEREQTHEKHDCCLVMLDEIQDLQLARDDHVTLESPGPLW